jgi:hypothetical protein
MMLETLAGMGRVSIAPFLLEEVALVEGEDSPGREQDGCGGAGPGAGMLAVDASAEGDGKARRGGIEFQCSMQTVACATALVAAMRGKKSPGVEVVDDSPDNESLSTKSSGLHLPLRMVRSQRVSLVMLEKNQES